jgi:uncharacterized protein (DUF1778 family)
MVSWGSDAVTCTLRPALSRTLWSMAQDSTPSHAQLAACLPADVYAALKRAAEIQGCTLAAFVVDAAHEAARRVLAEVELVQLSREDQHSLAETMVDPPPPTKPLERAFQRRHELLVPDHADATDTEVEDDLFDRKVHERAYVFAAVERELRELDVQSVAFVGGVVTLTTRKDAHVGHAHGEAKTFLNACKDLERRWRKRTATLRHSDSHEKRQHEPWRHEPCDSVLIRSERWDAYYCPVCNEWLERRCDDPTCEFCAGRPERPS